MENGDFSEGWGAMDSLNLAIAPRILSRADFRDAEHPLNMRLVDEPGSFSDRRRRARYIAPYHVATGSFLAFVHANAGIKV
ncbi:MAG: hypothetical protein DRP71_14790 [Verrucomicrobia bacterium]|nr:MAG: hypothetical protein DRP71_14790 [Verrucomicrobiota bacterium]